MEKDGNQDESMVGVGVPNVGRGWVGSDEGGGGSDGNEDVDDEYQHGLSATDAWLVRSSVSSVFPGSEDPRPHESHGPSLGPRDGDGDGDENDTSVGKRRRSGNSGGFH